MPALEVSAPLLMVCFKRVDWLSHQGVSLCHVTEAARLLSGLLQVLCRETATCSRYDVGSHHGADVLAVHGRSTYEYAQLYSLSAADNRQQQAAHRQQAVSTREFWGVDSLIQRLLFPQTKMRAETVQK
eukprot:SAG25_NODE_1494_length_2905_cov_1.799715_3_plen_129_part_00